MRSGFHCLVPARWMVMWSAAAVMTGAAGSSAEVFPPFPQVAFGGGEFGQGAGMLVAGELTTTSRRRQSSQWRRRGRRPAGSDATAGASGGRRHEG